jgi:succinate dehydrogenase / fumarate reductase flavoprotein subunit
MKLVNPANRRKYIHRRWNGLAGALPLQRLQNKGTHRLLCFQDSPRRAHSIAAQGGINAAKNYPMTAIASSIIL